MAKPRAEKRVTRTTGNDQKRQSMSDDQSFKLSTSAPFDRKDTDHAIALKDAKHDHFASSSPATLTRTIAANTSSHHTRCCQ
jgi:hypothetical protein